jgi:aminoglycoside phosphotransferase (APT) family kinase protein
MPSDPAVAPAVRGDVRLHAAARAWGRAGGGRDPVEIRILRKPRPGRKQAYWLAGAGPGGTPIVAKLVKRRTADLEHKLYAEVLPWLPVPCLAYLGHVEEDASRSWTFLEYASGERYSPASADHRRLAGEWLGLMHAAAADIPQVAELGDRGPDYFLANLRLAREAVASQLEGTTAPTARKAMQELLATLEAVETRWDDVREACETQPTTLVHGDFARCNLRVRSAGCSRSRLQVFDWGESGYGSPAVDLTQVVDPKLRMAANPSLDAYRRALSTGRSAPTVESLKRLAAAGKILRCLSAINWEAAEFGPWYSGTDKLRAYVHWLDEGARGLGWRSRRAHLAQSRG